MKQYKTQYEVDRYEILQTLAALEMLIKKHRAYKEGYDVDLLDAIQKFHNTPEVQSICQIG